MAILGAVALQTLWAMVGRLVTAKGVEWLLMWGAERLVSMTDTPHDDEFLAGVKKLLAEPANK
tara:strand:- start:186 stop:374 length:189 start_codon:yes stop_codon:yes gene_type:complete